jgi:hypothetical protein
MYTPPPAITIQEVYRYLCVYTYQGREYSEVVKAPDIDGAFKILEAKYKGCAISSAKKI